VDGEFAALLERFGWQAALPPAGIREWGFGSGDPS
jgi:hypothetical protein